MKRVAMRIGGALAAAYGGYVAATWVRYGHPKKPREGEVDPLLDRFMPEYDVVDRRSAIFDAPTDEVFEAACDVDLGDSPVVSALMKTRELLLGGYGGQPVAKTGLIRQMRAIGWAVLAEMPGREIVLGAATQPWESHVVFRGIPAEEFAAFDEPEFVKIVWCLRVDPLSPERCVFRTETRAMAGAMARPRFRTYWAFLSPGIVLIRLVILQRLRQEIATSRSISQSTTA